MAKAQTAAWQERERLRARGQFWTPAWVAEAMVAFVMGRGASQVFDPAVGAGAFLHAAKAVAARLGRRVSLGGFELDQDALVEARQAGLTDDDLANVEIRDFILRPPSGPFDAVVANPPYVRHHRLPPELKAFLKALSTKLIGKPLDGRAGLHIFFLLRALDLLAPGGRLAFIIPADTLEGVFSHTLWGWVLRNFRLDAVVTFDDEAAPFPGVDTNAIIVMLSRLPVSETFQWARCLSRGEALLRWVESEWKPCGSIRAVTRSLSEGATTGLSREPQDLVADGPRLSDFARTVRGIATGANDFFFLTKAQAAALGIPEEFLTRAIGRTRDVDGDVITVERLAQLDTKDRPTLLFSPDGRALGSFPPAVRDYLMRGQELGLPARPLIASRKPWYKMERRPVPPFLFAYLGRRSARFVRNEAGVLPLTGFLCVYPHSSDPAAAHKLWTMLSHPDTVANLRLVGKSYGSGAIKVEPRALERLPIPKAALAAAGLEPGGHRPQLSAL